MKRDVEVGKEAPSFQHTFVKIGGDVRVFHARENLKSRFNQTTDDLRDKSVLYFEPSELEAIELNDGKSSLRLTRKQIPLGEDGVEASWENPEGPVDDSGVSELLSVLSNLKCRAFIYDRKRGDFKDPVYTVTLKGLEEHSLALFAKDEKNQNDYPGLSSRNESPFLLPEHQAERIMVPLERIVGPQ